MKLFSDFCAKCLSVLVSKSESQQQEIEQIKRANARLYEVTLKSIEQRDEEWKKLLQDKDEALRLAREAVRIPTIKLREEAISAIDKALGGKENGC